MLFDTHIHTRYSVDSNMAVEVAASQAAQLGLGIIITEHTDLAFPESETVTFDVGRYFQEYNSYHSDKVLLGIEIGMGMECVEENRRIVVNHPFDYVIGSIHSVDNMDIYPEAYYHSRTKRDAYEQYFGWMLKCLKTHDFIDSLGHIDYIARYARYQDPEIYYHEFGDWIDEILKTLAQNGKALEINTRRLTSPAAMEIIRPIYQRFYELGGQFVTIGSDAHKPQDIGARLDAGYALAEACKLKAVYFKQRKPETGR